MGLLKRLVMPIAGLMLYINTQLNSQNITLPLVISEDNIRIINVSEEKGIKEDKYNLYCFSVSPAPGFVKKSLCKFLDVGKPKMVFEANFIGETNFRHYEELARKISVNLDYGTSNNLEERARDIENRIMASGLPSDVSEQIKKIGRFKENYDCGIRFSIYIPFGVRKAYIPKHVK